MRTRCCAWIKDAPFGTEHADLTFDVGTLSAVGSAIGTAPLNYQLEYEVITTSNWVTSHVVARTHGDGWRRELVLRRNSAECWSGRRASVGDLPSCEPGVQPAELTADVFDVDLQHSPVTNLMPTRRIWSEGTDGPTRFTMAWISVPWLEIYRDDQIYTALRHDGDENLVKFESADDDFFALLTCDRDGIVVSYPGIARQL